MNYDYINNISIGNHSISTFEVIVVNLHFQPDQQK